MKKLQILLVAMSLTMVFVGCSNQKIEDNSSEAPQTSESSSKTEEDIDVSNEKSEIITLPNTPELMTGMTAVYWDADGNEQIVTAENQDNWYEYIEQTGDNDGKTSRWANAKTEDGSYWVWIPRFEYKLDSETRSIDINFVDVTSITPTDGFIIHPAFEDGSDNHFVNGEWDSELSGFWVAKYEISNNSGVPASVAGVTSWRDISIEDSYFEAQSIQDDITGLNSDEIDSHLMKNSEWGAVAYLAHSKYGRNGTEITVNEASGYITAGSTGATAFTNTDQSTTGNETGVFDMSGGGWERMASYMSNGHSNITKNASTIPNILTDRDEQGYRSKSTKYLTVYPFDTDDGNIQKNYEKYESLASDTYGYGDAVLEISTAGNGSTSWNGDMSNYLFTDDLLFLRGGNYYNGDGAGIFAFNSAGGGANPNLGFRVVLVSENNKSS